jgi:hypothetical protein
MKLPTLNIDLSVNLKTFQKKLAEANSDINRFAQKAQKITGVSLPGPLGAMAKAGGALGAVGTYGSLAYSTLSKPFQYSDMVMAQFAESVRNGTETMRAFAEGKDYRTSGISLPIAAALAAGRERVARDQAQGGGGLWDTFWGANMNEQGQAQGALGFLLDWASSIKENAKFATAFAGSALAGNDIEENLRRAEMAVAASAGGAQAYMTSDEINRLAKQSEDFKKQLREQNT